MGSLRRQLPVLKPGLCAAAGSSPYEDQPKISNHASKVFEVFSERRNTTLMSWLWVRITVQMACSFTRGSLTWQISRSGNCFAWVDKFHNYQQTAVAKAYSALNGNLRSRQSSMVTRNGRCRSSGRLTYNPQIDTQVNMLSLTEGP